ncbi:putative translation factor [Hyaloraphidium curvatum]|nr:putative translation factor [Hyaloraphidium curvatum]
MEPRTNGVGAAANGNGVSGTHRSLPGAERDISDFFAPDGSYRTRILRLSYAERPSPEWQPDSADLESLEVACALLRAGHPVAIPTETVYGLAAPLDRAAVARIFEAKRRPSDNPLIVHVSSVDMVHPLLPPGRGIPDIYSPLLRFWPGPLTLVLPAASTLPPNVTAGLPTVAVRAPSHPVAAALISLLDAPLAAPSANSSGRPSPTRAEHVLDDLDGRVALILDGGPCGGGIESTVVDGHADRANPVILRNGGVTIEMLRKCPGWEGVRYYKDLGPAAEKAAAVPVSADDDRPRAPGMKYRHYAPRGVCVVCQLDPPVVYGGKDDADLDAGKLERLKSAARKEASSRGLGGRIGILCALAASPAGPLDLDDGSIVAYNLGDPSSPPSHAAHLFAALRHADVRGAELVLIERTAEEGEGRGVRERVEKAAEGGSVRG